jgi:aspartyl-tRNA(Asn)/glutamyl-tRNA(Gln) amidotransferase subunit C
MTLMELTAGQIEHIAALARLEISAEEKESFRVQISSVLGYVGQLGQVDTKGVEPLCHGASLVNVTRADETVACDAETRRRVIDAFPDRDGDLLKVKAVFS